MMTCQRLLLFLKKWIMSGKYTGCKDQQAIQTYLFGIRKLIAYADDFTNGL